MEFNPIRAAVRTVNPRDPKIMYEAPKFKRAVRTAMLLCDFICSRDFMIFWEWSVWLRCKLTGCNTSLGERDIPEGHITFSFLKPAFFVYDKFIGEHLFSSTDND